MRQDKTVLEVRFAFSGARLTEGGIDIVGVGRAFTSANFAHTRTLHVVHFYEGCKGMRIPKVYGLKVFVGKLAQ